MGSMYLICSQPYHSKTHHGKEMLRFHVESYGSSIDGKHLMIDEKAGG